MLHVQQGDIRVFVERYRNGAVLATVYVSDLDIVSQSMIDNVGISHDQVRSDRDARATGAGNVDPKTGVDHRSIVGRCLADLTTVKNHKTHKYTQPQQVSSPNTFFPGHFFLIGQLIWR
jgi:hypothetical protein